MKLLRHTQGKRPRRFAPASFVYAVMAACICLSQIASAATYTWTGSGANTLYTNPSNWTPLGTPVASNDIATFSGAGVNTRNGLPETLLLDSSAPNPIGGNNGLNTIRLTTSQTTAVNFQSDSGFISKPFRIGHGAPTSCIVLEAGSGSLIFNGDTPNYMRFNFGQNGYGTATTHTFVNNNAPGGGVLKFGSGVIFGIGGSAIRTLVFDGTGDFIFNGRLLFNQQTYTLTKKGSGMLTMGGDATDTSDYTLLGITTVVRTNRIGLEAGTININNAGALATTGTLTISGGVINNTSGTAIALKTDPVVVVKSDVVFSGSNSLALGAGQVDLTGTTRTVTVGAGRFGLGGEIINGAVLGIIKNGAGTLVLSGTSPSYTGTTSVTSGALMVDGLMTHSPVAIASGAAFGGSGTMGTVMMSDGGTLSPGDLALIVTDTNAMVSGTFSGTIGATYSTLTLDKSVSDTGPLMPLSAGAALEFAFGRGLTAAKVAAINTSAATTPTIAFNNNEIIINDLTNGAADFGDYVLFSTDGTFASTFSGLTVTSGTITSGLTLAASSAYNQPSVGYVFKQVGENIVLRLFSHPIITCDDTIVAVQGWDFLKNITISGVITSNSVTGLPAGLYYDDSTHTISGRPTAAPGNYTVTIAAANPDITITKTVTIEVSSAVPAPSFTIDPAIVRPVAPFNYDITANNLPQTMTVISGMPPWMTLTLDAITGIWSISGTPPAGGGTWTIRLEAGNPTGTTQFDLTVIIADSTAAPVIISATSIVGVVNYPINYQIVATNSPAFYSISGTLPAGIVLSNLDGAIAGTPTASGTSNMTMNAVNSTGTGSSPLHVEILASMDQPQITSSATATGKLNQRFSYTLTAAPYVTALTVTSTLPSWMTYDVATATLSGTCVGDAGTWASLGSTWPVVVQASNIVGTVTGTINVLIQKAYPVPTITNSGTDTCYVGRPYSYRITLNSTEGVESYGATNLPPGLNVNTATGEITGTPTVVGSGTIYLAATTSGGTGNGAYFLNIVSVPPGPYINSPATADGATGQPFTYNITAETPATTYGAKGLPPGLTLDPATGVISGTPTAAGYYNVEITTTDNAGTFVAAVTLTLVPDTSTLATYAGALATPGFVDANGTAARFNQPSAAVIGISGTLYVADYANNAIRAIATNGNVTSVITSATQPSAIATDSHGNIYYADQQLGTIRKILPADNTVWVVASGLLSPGGIAIDATDTVYFTDSGNNVIKKISATDGTVSTIAGAGTPGSADGASTVARFNAPQGLAYDKATNTLYVADTLNSALRAVNLTTNTVSTLAGAAGQDGYWDGAGGMARFHTPQGLTIDAAGFIYVADTGNSTIRVCDPKTGFVGTLIGKPQHTGGVDGSGSIALLNLPESLIADVKGTGDIYVIDSGNSALRTLLAPPCIVTPLVSGTVKAGKTITLDGSAYGSPAPTYQWYKDGAQVSGTQSKTLVIESAKAADAATYKVVATSASGTASSMMKLAIDTTTSGGSTVVINGKDDGGGGGGAPSLWFLAGIAAIGFARFVSRRRKHTR